MTEICQICTFKKKLATIKPCDHKICTDCYFKIMDKLKICPFCRADLTKGVLTKGHVEIKKTQISYKDLEREIQKALNSFNEDSDYESE